jgi:hypothetical protein
LKEGKNVTVRILKEDKKVGIKQGYLMFSKAVDSLPITSIKMLKKKPQDSRY